MRFSSLKEWLDWQQTLHPLPMELKLDRVRSVAQRLGLLESVPPTVTVAGTNGKGTTASMVSRLLGALGYRVGLYTSPHLFRYNERIACNDIPIEDADLCAAFAAVDAAREAQSLTFFEFGTLAALYHFRTAQVDWQVLEVGLGGRGDAVNVWDAEIAVITSVDLDHEAWLGPDRESIGAQKAGILRPGHPLILGDRDPPHSVLEMARALQVPLYRQGHEYALDVGQSHFRWLDQCIALPVASCSGLREQSARADNLASALAVLHVLGLGDRLSGPMLGQVLPSAVAGRQQQIGKAPEWLFDVAHNPQAARELAVWLKSLSPCEPTVAIFGIMADKNIAAVLAPLLSCVQHWIAVTLPGPRALAASAIAEALDRQGLVENVSVCNDMNCALAIARTQAGSVGRILVFGSFITVQLAMEALGADQRILPSDSLSSP